jgi:hypothetical protein
MQVSQPDDTDHLYYVFSGSGQLRAQRSDGINRRAERLVIICATVVMQSAALYHHH